MGALCPCDLEEVGGLVRAHWLVPTDPGQREVVEGLLGAIDSLHLTRTEWRAALAGNATIPSPLEYARADHDLAVADPADQAMELAAATAQDGVQGALDFVPTELENLLAVRLQVRERLASSSSAFPLGRVMPWIWRPESTGAPLTPAGDEVGMELRVSRYDRARCHGGRLRREGRCTGGEPAPTAPPLRPLGIRCRSGFDGAARIYRTCRRAGVTPRGMVDCMIAAVARRSGATLLAGNADMNRITELLGIDLDEASRAL